MSALAAPLDVYEGGLAARRLMLGRRDGSCTKLPIARWLGEPASFDRAALRRAAGPVLDVGCGPGRHLAALARSGIQAHGVDVSRSAVRSARRRGGEATHGSVFDPVPGEGGYATALLLDGNVGIGGDPVALLRRVDDLLAAGGRVLAEVDPPGRGTRRELVRLEVDGWRSQWFAWAHVDADGVAGAAAEAGLQLAELVEREGRWLAVLDCR